MGMYEEEKEDSGRTAILSFLLTAPYEAISL